LLDGLFEHPEAIGVSMHVKHLSCTFFFHRVFRSLLVNLFARRSLHDGLGFSQGLKGGEVPLMGELIANGV
jgi:hypothetical protein